MPTSTATKENNMLRALALILSLALAGSALAHSDSKWTKGPQGGHIVDAGGGKQHWELVAKGNELTLYVLGCRREAGQGRRRQRQGASADRRQDPQRRLQAGRRTTR